MCSVLGFCRVRDVFRASRRLRALMSQSMCEFDGSFITLRDIEGFEDRKNTLLYHRPHTADGVGNGCHVVFFPGDVQDFAENMKEHPSSAEWIDWSYEATSDLLSGKFPACHIWLIVPSKKIYKTFSIYKNFVKSESLFGVPTHDGSQGGLPHLEMLLKNASKQVSNAIGGNIEVSSQLPVKLVAFSKGCIVLNQILHEAAAYIGGSSCACPEVFSLIERITDFFWLDGGHSGDKDIWVRDRNVLNCLKSDRWRKDLKIHVHVTPYQVNDDARPWKGQEEEEFVAALSDLHVDFSEKRHFENEDAQASRELSLQKHFEVLRVF